MTDLLAPFPYFGGKSRIAATIWQHFGDVDNYVEPFMGSLAVLLARPQEHSRNVETVNDTDHYLSNFWRAVQAEPEEVARWADWPANECDLTARHIWLVNEGRERLAHLEADPDVYDPKVAGWWLWGICIWVGSGWCSGTGPWGKGDDGRLIHLGNAGRGVNRKRIHLGDAGQGVNRQRIHLGNAGQGVNRQYTDIYGYMRALADRLRRVRVCCGNWQRVVTTGALSYGANVGILLDPPYAQEVGRDMGLYNHDDPGISTEVRKWAIANGDNPRYRIALCGYEGEHDMPEDWMVIRWTAGASYKTVNGDKNKRRKLERVWFSPHCLTMPLFAGHD